MILAVQDLSIIGNISSVDDVEVIRTVQGRTLFIIQSVTDLLTILAVHDSKLLNLASEVIDSDTILDDK